MSSIPFLKPDWPVPDHIRAVTTLRDGGVSTGPYASLNLAMHVSDTSADVALNRERVSAALGLRPAQICWLNQVHSNRVVPSEQANQGARADASFSHMSGHVCCVMTADCLPILLTNEDGSQVAAVHAGWRGLVSGVIENTLARFQAPATVLAWLGPAIGPAHFEVGAEVREEYLKANADLSSAFKPAESAGKYFLDLYEAARRVLQASSVTRTYGGDFCTFEEASRFYSYRRDGANTGRMASLIWISE